MLERTLRVVGVDRSPIPHLNRQGLSRRFLEMLNGNKPTTYVDPEEVDIHRMQEYWKAGGTSDIVKALETYFKRRGFECISFIGAHGQQKENDLIIARKENFGTFLDENPPISIPRFDQRVQKLIAQEHLRDLRLAKALQVLFARKGIDPDDVNFPNAVELAKEGMEYPEVSILLGKILGYPDCDVAYFVKTRFGIEFQDPYEEGDISPVYDKRFDSTGSLLCPECFQKAVAQDNIVKVYRPTQEEIEEYIKMST